MLEKNKLPGGLNRGFTVYTIRYDQYFFQLTYLQSKLSSFIDSLHLILKKIYYLIQIKHSNHWKDGFKVLILELHPFTMKRTWIQSLTSVQLAHVQAVFFFHKLESLAGENINFSVFGENKIKYNNFLVSKQFQRTHSV